jgi:hypothetical protein
MSCYPELLITTRVVRQQRELLCCETNVEVLRLFLQRKHLYAHMHVTQPIQPWRANRAFATWGALSWLTCSATTASSAGALDVTVDTHLPSMPRLSDLCHTLQGLRDDFLWSNELDRNKNMLRIGLGELNGGKIILPIAAPLQVRPWTNRAQRVMD